MSLNKATNALVAANLQLDVAMAPGSTMGHLLQALDALCDAFTTIEEALDREALLEAFDRPSSNPATTH